VYAFYQRADRRSEDFGKCGAEVPHAPQGNAQSMKLIQLPGISEVRQIKGLTKVLRENTTAIGPKRTGWRDRNQLRQLDSEQTADPGLKSGKGRAAEMPPDRCLLQPAQCHLMVDVPYSVRMRGELLLQSSAGQKIDPDIEVADVSEHGIQVLEVKIDPRSRSGFERLSKGPQHRPHPADADARFVQRLAIGAFQRSVNVGQQTAEAKIQQPARSLNDRHVRA
jgi:hypothetical protein